MARRSELPPLLAADVARDRVVLACAIGCYVVAVAAIFCGAGVLLEVF